ncbi:MAG: hypothetical protein J6D26_04085 [Clostridia bacterium]|nr:hypothetical protein [Clostridia bacterium]
MKNKTKNSLLKGLSFLFLFLTLCIGTDVYAQEDAILYETFEDYTGELPAGAMGTGRGTASSHDDIFGTSYALANIYLNDAGEITAKMYDELKYDLSSSLQTGTYVLNFSCLFETVPADGEAGRLFMCKIGGTSSGSYLASQTFMVGNGYMGYAKGMKGWTPSNSGKFVYVANRWYDVSMVLELTAESQKIHYYIDGIFYGTDTITETVYPISRIEFRLEDNMMPGSMYLDNIELCKMGDANKLRILAGDEAESTSLRIGLQLPMTEEAKDELAQNPQSIVLKDQNQTVVGIDSITIHTPRMIEVTLTSLLATGEYTLDIADEVETIFADVLAVKPINFQVYTDRKITDVFDLGSVYTTLTSTVQENKLTARPAKGKAMAYLCKQGIEGAQLIPKTEMHTAYFSINDTTMKKLSDGSSVEVTVAYFDAGNGMVNLFYDSQYLAKDFGGMLVLTDTNTWKIHTFQLPAPYFNGRMTGAVTGSDFSLTVFNPFSGYSAGQVLIGGVGIKMSDPIAPVKLELTSQHFGNIFYRGETIAFDLNFLKQSTKEDIPQSYEKQIEVLDYTGEPVWREDDILSFSKGLLVNERIQLPSLPYGIYTLRMTVKNGSLLSQREYEFSYVNSDLGATNNQSLGICMHYALSEAKKWNNDPTLLLDLMDKAGIGYIRDNFNLNSFATLPTGSSNFVYAMPELWQDYITKITARGMNLLPIAEGVVPGFDEDPVYTPEAQAVFAVNAAAFAKELETLGVHAFELNNEYNLAANRIPPENASGEEYYNKADYYAEFLNQVYTKVKAFCPTFTLVGGAIADIPVEWLDVLFQGIQSRQNDSNGQLMDVLSVHPYKDLTESELGDYLSSADTLAGEYGLSYPLWATEYGWSTSGQTAVSEELQATNVVQRYVTGRAQKAFEKAFIYSYKDGAVDVTSKGSGFGILRAYDEALLDVPCSAKPSYLAVSNMNLLLADATGSEVVEEQEDGVNIYKFTMENQDTVYVFWGNGTYALNLQTPQITLVDMYGNETLMESQAGAYVLKATDTVSYVKVPYSHIPVYIIDEDGKCQVFYGGSSFFPMLIDEKGTQRAFNLSGTDGDYTMSFDLQEDDELWLLWQEGDCLNRFKVFGSAYPLEESERDMVIGVDSKAGSVTVSGITQEYKKKLLLSLKYSHGKQGVGDEEEYAHFTFISTDESGRFSLKFPIEVTSGRYELSLYVGKQLCKKDSFYLLDEPDITLVQNEERVTGLSKIDKSKPLTGKFYLGNLITEMPNTTNTMVIVAYYTKDALSMVQLYTLAELGWTQDLPTVFNESSYLEIKLDAVKALESDAVKLMVWENFTMTPLMKSTSVKK